MLMVGAIAGILFWFYYDEPLRPEARFWVDQTLAAKAEHSPAYYYLNGMRAQNDYEIEDLARYYLVQSDREVRDFYVDEGAVQKSTHDLDIALLDMAFADMWEGCVNIDYECYEILFDLDSGYLSGLLSTQSVLLERYNHFFTLGPLVTQHTRHLVAKDNNFSELRLGQWLYFMHVLLRTRSHGCLAVLENVSRAFADYRLHIQHADTMANKIIFLHMANKHLDFLSMLKQRECADISISTQLFTTLTESELSMREPFIGEFVGMYNTFSNVGRDQNLVSGTVKIPEFINGFFFNKNATLNYFYEDYLALTEYTPTAEYSEEDTGLVLKVKASSKAIKNRVGWALHAFLSPHHYTEYPLRVHLLNTKIALINFLYADDQSYLVNPSFPGLQPTYDQQSGRLCLLLPNYRKHLGFQCLQISDRTGFRIPGNIVRQSVSAE